MGKGRAPCCAKVGLNKGCWTPEEDMRLIAYIQKYGHANWRALPKQAGLLRCGKSCRLRWINYLRPDLKRGNFTVEEEETIIKLHCTLGNKWSKIAACLPGRTDNEIKNVWNTHLKKRVAPPCGPREQEHGAGGDEAKNKKKKKLSEVTSTVPSPSPASSTTTNCYSSNDSGEQQSNAEPDQELGLGNLIDIPMLDDFDDVLVDIVPELYCPSSAPTSPRASSESSPPAPRGAVDLPPEIDTDQQELWSVMDDDVYGGGKAVVDTEGPAPCHGNETEANAATTTTSQEEEEWWWLENLERELGLWGPMEDYHHHYQHPTVRLVGLAHPDALPAMVLQDPVTCYFQAGPELTSTDQMKE